MNLSITTDYYDSHNDPNPQLHAIRGAGFSHVHWCHEWDTDYFYSGTRIAEIRNELIDLGLSVDNLHASEGRSVGWGHSRSDARRSGVDLVKNRLEMAAELGAREIILHASDTLSLDAQKASLAELIAYAEGVGVRIAIENLPEQGFGRVWPLLDEYESDTLGFCLDTGHAVMNERFGYDDFGEAEKRCRRLAAVHLHDNNGEADQHRLPFTGKVPWKRVAALIAGSPYRGCLTLEVGSKQEQYADDKAFLRAAYSAGTKLDNMLAIDPVE
ncbi:MAG: sugar phosphate isomerase/epimerase family protein [Spirochaetia bacterium]